MIVSKISVVSVVSDEIISYLTLEISVVSVMTGDVIFHVLHVGSVVSDESISSIQNQRKLAYSMMKLIFMLYRISA